MQYSEFINLAKKKKQSVLIITASFLLLVLIFTFVQPLKYRATTKLLIVQNYGQTSDSYAISRSNQFITNILAQVVYSDNFFREVLNSGYNIDKEIFSTDINKRKKQWEKMVDTRAVADTGMIVINTYYQDKETADQINQAIAYTLKLRHAEYHGLGENVSVKVIDTTTVSDFPVKPNIILNLIFGLVFGFGLGLYFVYFFPTKEIKIKLWQRRKNNISPDLINYGYVGQKTTPEFAAEPVYDETAEMENENDLEYAAQEDSSADFNNNEVNFVGDINNVLKS